MKKKTTKTTNIAKYAFNDEVTNEMLLEFINKLHKAFNTKIKTPEYESKRLTNRKWGSYGWTWLPDINYQFYDTCPSTRAEADLLMENECTDTIVNGLLNEMHLDGHLTDEDYKAITDNLHAEHFQAVSLIALSCTDGHLVRRQREEDKNRGRRPHGKKAAENIIRHFNEEELAGSRGIMVLRYENIMSCANTIFADGKDFIEPMKIINRNYLMHGMCDRVSKKEAFQTILFFYNLIVLLSFIDEISAMK